MDAKALAKSKRAHSLHHKKKHPTHQGLKAPSAGSDDKKAAGKQEKERPQKSHGQQTKERIAHNQSSRTLPSNWDRYDEEMDLASEEAHTSSSQPTESVLPKSKRADYAYLISEAKAQSQLQYSDSSDVLPLFDDFISDFTQDFGPMLAAKGQSILSWIADDSFEFESKASMSIEVPFLSINLNALAEQLAKAKLSERLYLQSDVLPLKLLDDAHDEEKHDHQTIASAAETNTISSSLAYDLGVNMNVQQHHEPGSSSITATRDDLVQTSEEEPNPVKQHSVEMMQSHEINRSHSTPMFEAATAEAELDMLLNSFSETSILDSGASLAGTPSSAEASAESMKTGTHMVKPVSNPANIDDAIDNLLDETSIVDGEKMPLVTKVNSETSKSSILDDFDSWLDTI